MKISIAINGYKPENKLSIREKLCVDSLVRLKNKHTNSVFLYNVNSEGHTYEHFETLHIDTDEKFTKINHLLDTLHKNTDTDLIMLLNNDIIVSDRLLKQLDSERETYMASRVNIEPIDSLDDPLQIVEYSVHGFDLIACKSDWWGDNRMKLPDMYIGRQYWDTVYLTILMTHSDCQILNKLPPVIFHQKHETVSTEEDVYDEHNKKIAGNYGDMRKWWSYVYNVLLKRESHNDAKYWWPFKNETRLERAFFDD